MLLKSSTLFLVCFVFILIALLLDISAFATDHWVVTSDWNTGLWQICVSGGQTSEQGDVLCFPVQDYAYRLSNVQPNSTGTESPGGWFKAVQTSETFGLICSIICTVMVGVQLFYVSRPRLQRVTVFVCAFTGIFTDIGVLLVVLNYSISVTGYSFWMALISSLFFYMAGGLIELDLLRKGQIEDIILQGEPIKGGILVHVCGSGRSDRPITPPVSPTGEAALENEDNIAYQTPRAKAVIKDRPSSVVFVPLPEIEQQQRKRDSTGSRGMRISVTEFPPEGPPPPYSPFSENRTETPRKKKNKK